MACGFVVMALFALFFLACDSRPTKTEKPNTYPHPKDLRTDIAWIVIEWNGKPKYGGYGSGFLADKHSGSFYTNKHVSDMFDSFGSSEFPDPAPVAKEKVKKGDKVFVEGFHPHHYFFRESNRIEGGYNEKLVPIFKEYYNIDTKDLVREREVVFERISGVVVETDASVFLNQSGSSGSVVNRAREMANKYFMVKTDRDHKFSFGGLSGTAVKNIKGEIVGILTVEKTDFKELENDEDTGIKIVTYL